MFVGRLLFADPLVEANDSLVSHFAEVRTLGIVVIMQGSGEGTNRTQPTVVRSVRVCTLAGHHLHYCMYMCI